MDKVLSSYDREIAQLKEQLSVKKKRLAEAKRKHDTHVKCAIAGALLSRLGISDIGGNLETKKQTEAFKKIVIDECVEAMTNSEHFKQWQPKFKEKCASLISEIIKEELEEEKQRKARKKSK